MALYLQQLLDNTIRGDGILNNVKHYQCFSKSFPLLPHALKLIIIKQASECSGTDSQSEVSSVTSMSQPALLHDNDGSSACTSISPTTTPRTLLTLPVVSTLIILPPYIVNTNEDQEVHHHIHSLLSPADRYCLRLTCHPFPRDSAMGRGVKSKSISRHSFTTCNSRTLSRRFDRLHLLQTMRAITSDPRP